MNGKCLACKRVFGIAAADHQGNAIVRCPRCGCSNRAHNAVEREQQGRRPARVGRQK